MRLIEGLVVVIAAVLATAVPGAAQAILGAKFALIEKPGFPTTRKLSLKAQEAVSLEAITGDPFTNGATLQVIVNGTTPSSQTMALPPGSRWRGASELTPLGKAGWKYAESTSVLRGGRVTPVRGLVFARSSTGKFKITLTMDSRYVPLEIGVPNIGTFAGIVLTVSGGPTYCVNFGGMAGGIFGRNDALGFKVSKPLQQGVCPTGTPVCGDGIIDSPFETCDVGNDLACPGLCGVNGLACLCPFCGDAAIDPGESCDGQAHLGSCTEGCSYTCGCAVCGDGITQIPVEDCDGDGVDAGCGEGLTCAPPGAPNQCRCPICGDGIIQQGEQCETGDDTACPGGCMTDTCLCAVCGNGVQEQGEECDGSDGCSTCLPNCTCATCGNAIVEPPVEQCEATDDSACPGLCDIDCVCAVCGDNWTNYPQEQCDGTDDGACPGLCQLDCTCP